MSAFELHPQLQADTVEVIDLTLCKVLLMNDSQYPWLILVPRRADSREIYELSTADQAELWREVSHCGQALMQLHNGFKLNIGALGNMVPQLHIHVIARQASDPAWPGPVWGVNPAVPYSATALTEECSHLQNALT